MKIGIDLSFVRPDHKNGGTEAFVKNLIKGFAVLEAQGKLEDEIVYFIHRDIYRDYSELFPKLQYRIYDLKGSHPVRTIRFQTFVLPRLARKEKLDLLYFPTFQTGLRRKWRIPIAVTPHDIQYKYYPAYFSPFKRRYFQIFYSEALKKADRVAAISDYVRSSYQRYFPAQTKGKLRLIYDPIDFDAATEEPVMLPEGCSGYVLCINSLTKHKNLITLIKAFEKLLQDDAYRELKLVIGGAKWNSANELSDYIKKHGMERQVVLTGYVNDGQLAYLYHHARLFVTSSLYEGFGMTPIEAMAAECPVISSKETSLYEVTKGLAHYYGPAADADALCAAMREELKKDRKEIAGQLSENRKAVLCYSKEKAAADYLDLFHETAGLPIKTPETDQAVYGKLFTSVSETMQEQGVKLPCTRESFLGAVGVPPRRVDIGRLSGLTGETLVDGVWLSCFQRLPSAKKRCDLKDKSDAEILKAAAFEGSFAVRGIKLIHNPYFKRNCSMRGQLLSLAAGIKHSIVLRRLAKRMPDGLQKKIRGLFC